MFFLFNINIYSYIVIICVFLPLFSFILKLVYKSPYVILLKSLKDFCFCFFFWNPCKCDLWLLVFCFNFFNLENFVFKNFFF